MHYVFKCGNFWIDIWSKDRLLKLAVGEVMNRRYIVAVAFLGLAACTTSGPEAPAPGASNEAVATSADENAADDDTLYCRRERLTGSRIPTTVCMTRAERDSLQEVAQGNMEAIRRTPSAVPQN
jgi:hypothetical protein